MTHTVAKLNAPRALIVTTVATVATLAWSAWHPHDLATWFMEVAPVLIVLPLLWLTRRSFPLTPLLYTLIALHAISV
jgi:putative membrane protein